MPLTKVQSRGTENVGQGSSNLIINGAMNVSQRGTSFTIDTANTNTYCFDRFFFSHNANTNGQCTVTQDSSAPNGFKNSFKVDVTTADTSLAVAHADSVYHRIEAQNLQGLAFGTSDAKNITLSFYVKSNKTGTYSVNIAQNDNSYKQANLTYTINSADTWERKTLTFTGDTSGVINDDNGHGLEIAWHLALGTNFTSGSNSASFASYADANFGANHGVNIFDNTSNEWFLTGVQLEIGSQASDFQHEDIGTTRKKCMRYFHSINGAGHSDPTDSAYGRYICFGQDNNGLRWFHHFPEEMRSAPTMTANNISSSTIQHFNYNTQTGISMTGTGLNEGGKRTGQIFFTFSSGAGVGSTVSWRWNNNPDASFDFNSEL